MTKKTLPAVHPGEVLLEDFMKPMGLSRYRVAKDIGVSPLRVSEIVRGERAISVDTAMRLAHYFGTSAGVWLHAGSLRSGSGKAGLAERIHREVKILAQAPRAGAQ